MNGIPKNGLKIIGIPNIIGSLILNNAGSAEILTIVFICLDLAKINPEIIRPKVAPAPPIHTNHCKYCSENGKGIFPISPGLLTR